jgi:transcriptional regulator with XRE-family HTH domain
MNLLLIVRQSLGFNQETMAGLLGVKITTYKMAETDRRSLPSEALSRLTWIYNTVQSLPETDAPPFEPLDLKTVLHKTRKKKMTFDKAVEETNTKWKQMQKRLAFQPLFQEQFPADNHFAETSYMAAQVYYAQYFIQSTNRQEELHIKAMQVGLAAMLEFLEQEEKR